jgi:phosphoesterase RecJ-like protein
VIATDAASPERLGSVAACIEHRKLFINIDHHDTNEAFGFLNILDQRASSTAEIIYLILKSLDIKIDFNIAVNLYTAILTDTGSFRYDNTNSRAFVICEEMTHAGVVPSHVAAEVYESHPRERFELLCQALATMETHHGNKLAIIHITQDMFRQTHGSREQSEGFVEFLKEMRGLEVAMLARQIGKDRYKISMRSKSNVDVAAIANRFGGGGHKKAAGCVIEGSIDEVKKKLVEATVL